MSSSSITVKPRRRSAQSPPPSKHPTNQNTETVLLRNPLPKYSFETKKGPSGVTKKNTSNETDNTSEKSKISSDEKTATKVGAQEDTVNAKGVNIVAENVENIHHKILENNSSTPSINIVSNFPSKPMNPSTCTTTLTAIPKSDNSEKPVNKVGPISKNSGHILTHSVSDSVINSTDRSQSGTIQHSDISLPSTTETSETPSSQNTVCNTCQNTAESAENLVDRSTEETKGCKCSEKLKHLEEEKQMLKNQLEVQLQVNQELKKLLVASVGEDVQHRVERLTRDKALLSLEIGDYSKKICDDYEHLDKISIQADMWRSKYLACRVMADELASSKAFYTMQFQESQLALEKMLNERHQIRANLYDTYRGLEQIQEAFDPLGSQSNGSRLLASKNVIDLARTNHQLVESIKYRLLPSHVTSVMSGRLEPDWHDYLTQAEAHAKELLSREMRPEDFRCLVPSRNFMPAPGALSVDRYHPFANYDNLTLNVCCKCKGEIRIV
ncbi:DASH complex subunit Hsk3 like [Mactra antiquata]